MIKIVHNLNLVQKVYIKNTLVQNYENCNIIDCLFNIAKKHENQFIVWVHQNLLKYINIEEIEKNEIYEIQSFSNTNFNFINDKIGYIDQRSCFLNFPKNIKYATWQLSTDIGVINSKTLLNFSELKKVKYFDNFLVHLGKVALTSGLFVYSNPNLLQNCKIQISKRQCNNFELFLFAKKNYTSKMYFYLFISFLIFEYKLLIIPFLYNSLKNKNLNYSNKIQKLFVKNEINTIQNETIDVVIPTLGRANFLYNVLIDLNNQTKIPTNVIIIEQDDCEIPKSELDFINQNNWKFNINHKLINQLGACNARNLALKEINSDWIFLADDDIRIPNNTIEKTINYLINYKLNAASIACYTENLKNKLGNYPFIWSEFSSGCSIIKKEYLKTVFFNMDYEFGYCEDTDFGFQLRNKGCLIVYYNLVELLHLKAPIGGFRKKIIRNWDQDKIKPKPLPSEMKFLIENYNKYQFKGFKLIYILKNTKTKNPFLAFKQFKISQKYYKQMFN